ncbi:WD40 repeat domain-containing protein [Streptomyces sp. NPDC054864]
MDLSLSGQLGWPESDDIRCPAKTLPARQAPLNKVGPLLPPGGAPASDGRTLATGSVRGSVRLWDTETRRSTASLSARIEGASSLAFSPDGRTLAAPADGDTSAVHLWDVARPPTESRPSSVDVETGRARWNSSRAAALSPSPTKHCACGQ